MIPILGDLVKGAASIIDQVHTSDEERAEARRKLAQLQIDAGQQLLEYEATRVREGGATIRAEAQSGSWLAANWRPITMLSFVGLVAAHWLGATPDVPEAEVLKVLDIVHFALGGYVLGRSAEKVLPMALKAMKGKP